MMPVTIPNTVLKRAANAACLEHLVDQAAWPAVAYAAISVYINSTKDPMPDNLLPNLRPIFENIIRATGLTREAAAKELAAAAEDMRTGGIVPEEAWARALADHKRVQAQRDSLPSRPE